MGGLFSPQYIDCTVTLFHQRAVWFTVPSDQITALIAVVGVFCVLVKQSAHH